MKNKRVLTEVRRIKQINEFMSPRPNDGINTPLKSETDDPSKEEMVTMLSSLFPNDGGDENHSFNVEEAIYWFAANYHGGQWSKLYSALSTSEFTPGQSSNGPDDEMSQMMYDKLASVYGGEEERNDGEINNEMGSDPETPSGDPTMGGEPTEPTGDPSMGEDEYVQREPVSGYGDDMDGNPEMGSELEMRPEPQMGDEPEMGNGEQGNFERGVGKFMSSKYKDKDWGTEN